LRYEVIPYAKDYFEVVDKKTGKRRFVDMKNKDFIVVSVREEGSDGRFYAVDKDGTVWLSGPISSGVPQFRTPSGVFHIFKKNRYYMSKRYPDERGINNMNYAMWFHKGGYALHEGDPEWMSHGCVHIGTRDVATLFRWSRIGMPVIVTRHSYMPFAQGDLRRIYDKKR
jgi:lipoprotein-anchoring transpeptidase ErfK/SrfK